MEEKIEKGMKKRRREKKKEDGKVRKRKEEQVGDSHASHAARSQTR